MLMMIRVLLYTRMVISCLKDCARWISIRIIRLSGKREFVLVRVIRKDKKEM